MQCEGGTGEATEGLDHAAPLDIYLKEMENSKEMCAVHKDRSLCCCPCRSPHCTGPAVCSAQQLRSRSCSSLVYIECCCFAAGPRTSHKTLSLMLLLPCQLFSVR